jgi:cytochrome c biogenesis protein CcmG/thiol:disulfide interchange protein DsbE
VVASIIGGLLLALVVLFATASGDNDEADSGELIGSPAPEIAATTTAGEQFSLSDVEGRWALVNFFATWCPPCVAEHPELVAFSENNPNDAEVVSVAFDEPADVISEFFSTHGGDWPVVAEDTAGTVIDYGVVKLPESFLVNPDGTVVKKYSGGVTASELEADIQTYESTGSLDAQ